ncbi:hypothetical protein FHG87_012432 [Trinorchestia longiramus]|nr:hypothetical protein FHG87_012432 [Trinorchestia longiramus]
MSIGEGGRLSASSSGLGSLNSVDGHRQKSSRQCKIPSGKELYRENITAWKPCEETCGYCQLECPNCASYAALSVQRIDGKVQQVWTIVNKSSASTKNNVNEWNTSYKNKPEESELTGYHGNDFNTYTSLGNVSTLCSRRAVHLISCKDCVPFNASAPPLSRPQSSDSGLYDLSEGKPVPFDKRLGLETIAYSYTVLQGRTKNRISPSSQSEMSELGEESAGTGVAAKDTSDEEVSPVDREEDSSSGQDPSLGSDTQVSEHTAEPEETEGDKPKEGSEEPPSKEKVTNPFEEGYEEPVVERSRTHDEGPNPFDDDETNPFNTNSPTSSANSCNSGSDSNSKKKSISPSTRPSSSILDVRKLLHPDKVHPIDLDDRPMISASEIENRGSQYDPEATVRQPSIVSSTGPTVFSKSALFLKQMLIGAAVIILVGVVVMFIASLGKSMMR